MACECVEIGEGSGAPGVPWGSGGDHGRPPPPGGLRRDRRPLSCHGGVMTGGEPAVFGPRAPSPADLGFKIPAFLAECVWWAVCSALCLPVLPRNRWRTSPRCPWAQGQRAPGTWWEPALSAVAGTGHGLSMECLCPRAEKLAAFSVIRLFCQINYRVLINLRLR